MPEKIIVFGGGNCEGVMGLELHRSFDWIDYICSGESDHSFPELLKRIAAKKPLQGIPGLIYRENGTSCVAGSLGQDSRHGRAARSRFLATSSRR